MSTTHGAFVSACSRRFGNVASVAVITVSVARVASLATPLPDDPEIASWEQKVRESIKNSGIEDAPELKDRLIRGLAYADRALISDKISRGIFGTQLAALGNMDASGPLAQAALQELHTEHETRVFGEVSEEPLDFLAWIGFLVNNGLATMNAQGSYQITDFGKFFRQYSANIGVTVSQRF